MNPNLLDQLIDFKVINVTTRKHLNKIFVEAIITIISTIIFNVHMVILI